MLTLVLLSLLSIEHLHSLMCQRNQSISLTRDQLQWTNLSDLVNNFEKSNTASICRVQLTVNYNGTDRDAAQLKFAGLPKNETDTRIEFGTTIQFFNRQIRSIVSHLDYRCASDDLCERSFLHQRAIPLLRTSDQPLHTNLVALWKNSSSTPYVCDAKQRTDPCLSYVCFVIYEELKQLGYGKSRCSDQASIQPVHIHVRTVSVNSAGATTTNDYRCTKNECTGQVAFDSPMKSNSISHSRMHQNENPTDQLHRLILQRALIIVGILLIIACIACYLQCRIYRQGYRLTAAA